MQTNFREIVNVNIPLPWSLYTEMKDYMYRRGIKTNASFVADAVVDINKVFVGFMRINDRDPSEFSALIRVGEILYRWDGRDFIGYGETETGEMLDALRRSN